MKLILLGSPGVGKGTYTQDLIKMLHLLHVSTGDMFRENLKKETPLGKKAKEYMDKGQLVPDEVTIAMVEERLSRDDVKKQGFILDGFPRTKAQAEALDVITKVDKVISFSADKEIIIQRLGGRMVCRSCGHIFHKINLPSKEEGICDVDGGELYTRDDDKPEAIEKRLADYEEVTKPLIDFYHEKGILREVNVNENYAEQKEMIQKRILDAIKS
ncbi:MAG: adenylate kinase [Candidatus Woesearchaeota archaeon]